MKSNNPERSKEQINRAIEREDTLPLAAARSPSSTGVIDNQDTWENDEFEAILILDFRYCYGCHQGGILILDSLKLVIFPCVLIVYDACR